MAAEDKMPTMWFYLWWDFFHRPVLELWNKSPFLSSSFLTSTVKKQSTSEPSHPFWNANPPQPGKEQVNILSPSSKATTGVCPRSGITRAQAWQSSAGANYSVSRGCKRKKRPSGGSGMLGEGDFPLNLWGLGFFQCPSLTRHTSHSHFISSFPFCFTCFSMSHYFHIGSFLS